jgi:hypothetical protein
MKPFFFAPLRLRELGKMMEVRFRQGDRYSFVIISA